MSLRLPWRVMGMGMGLAVLMVSPWLVSDRIMVPNDEAILNNVPGTVPDLALDAVEALEIPPDLDKAFASYEAAKPNFEAFPRSVKRAILEWISSAKKPETRGKRVEETARLAAENRRANQGRQ